MSLNATSVTDSIQDYLKEIYKLQADGRASTSAIAERIGVAPASVTAMLKKLAVLRLVQQEQYLAETLGLSIDAVHAEADRLEHALSEELEARIDESLGFPTHDPHGDPIPGPDLRLQPPELRTLADLEPGERATVRRIPDGSADLLRYLAELGLLPGEEAEFVLAAPFGGPVTVRVAAG